MKYISIILLTVRFLGGVGYGYPQKNGSQNPSQDTTHQAPLYPNTTAKEQMIDAPWVVNARIILLIYMLGNGAYPHTLLYNDSINRAFSLFTQPDSDYYKRGYGYRG